MDPLGSIKEVFIVIVLILMNGLLAMLEMALVSARKSRLEQLADEGSSKAAYILKLAQEPTEFFINGADRYHTGRHRHRRIQRRHAGSAFGRIAA